MKLHKQHLLYQADGNETGNSVETEELVKADENTAVDEDNTLDTSNISPEFAPDMSLEELEKGVEEFGEVATEDNKEADNADEVVEEQTNNQELDEQGNTESQENESEDVQKSEEVDSVTISDEYIESRPEDEQEILVKLKGKTTDPQLLKNYIHTQKHIKNLEAKLTEKEDAVYQPKVEQHQTEKTEKPLHALNNDELAGYNAKQITEMMQKKYSNFPDDALTNREVLNDYFSDMDYSKKADYEDMKAHLNNIKARVEENTYQQIEVGKNWKEHANATIQRSFSAFEQFLESEGVTAEDIGVNLDPKLAESILYDEQKNANPNVVFKKRGVPIIIEDRFTDALKIKLFNKISSFKEARARDSAYTRKKQNQPAPSLSSANSKGQPVQRKVLPTVMTPDMSLSDMEKILEKS